ncbi:GNAT family N-acetyltransferase [Oceanobacillus sp. 143]|uniref:Aminoglycoside N(6')-acetyltransferase type 1 n=1 Tax=Oceanobacillus zhaokaii TaxID=2052660 RepID=A0A345PCU4_9BACI|nr:aminoglycoside 6'-N-acetyltransferase [Oceanobacillus zhaokaii]AXI07824.1 GNAT family N-acetyltransferase [Oceanobacillus zhaokaii]QGS67934.1 GNAT family N-acetyltransferase [Oceanobacillus sp. 143]
MGEVIQASTDHLHELTNLAMDLWPDNDFENLKKEFAESIDTDQNKVFLYCIEKRLVAFIHLSIRTDYVEGSNSSPIGYIEGIYVLPEFRQKGISKKLFARGRNWLLNKGCKQVGSDIEWNNQVSYEFHKSIGFKEANRLIAFIQDL